MTDVAAEFAAAASALLAENAALKAQLADDAPRTVQHVSGMNYLGDLNNVELCAAPGSIQRISQQTGGSPTDIGTLIKIDIEGDWTNVYAHDLHGLGWWKAYHISTEHLGGTLRGCLLKDIGWVGADRPHGQSLYAQGHEDAPKHIIGSILAPSFQNTLQWYGSAASVLEGLHCQRTIFHGAGALVGGAAPLRAITLDECFFAGCAPWIGYQVDNDRDLAITNSVLGYWALTKPLETFTFRGNSVFNDGGGGLFQIPFALTDARKSNWDVDHNTYYTDLQKPFSYGGGLTLAEWQQATGFDQHSVVLPAPTTPIVRVYPVEAGRHRCNIAVYNRLLQPSITVPLPLTKGGTYQLRQVQDYANDVRPFVYDGVGLTIQLAGSYALPDGISEPLPSLVGNLTPKYIVFEVWD